MPSINTAALAVTLLLVCAGGNAQSPAGASFPAEQIKRGATLYASNCESCHGVRMIGPPWAIDLATFPRDRPDRFVDSVTNGVRTMPPWGDVLKPDEIQALWAYVVAGEPKN
jgi:mono/diheme cytochrome c family protein